MSIFSNYEAGLLYDQLLTANQATIELYPPGDIPRGGRHIYCELVLKTSRLVGSEGVLLTINGDAGNNYDCYVMWHNYNVVFGNTVAQVSLGPPAFCFATGTIAAVTNSFAIYNLWIYNYDLTTQHKQFQSRGGQRTSNVNTALFLYDAWGEYHPASLARITSVRLTPQNGFNFVIDSRCTVWIH